MTTIELLAVIKTILSGNPTDVDWAALADSYEEVGDSKSANIIRRGTDESTVDDACERTMNRVEAAAEFVGHDSFGSWHEEAEEILRDLYDLSPWIVCNALDYFCSECEIELKKTDKDGLCADCFARLDDRDAKWEQEAEEREL